MHEPWIRCPAAFTPRLEQLSGELGLDATEKLIILTLVGSMISPDVRKAVRAVNHSQSLDIGAMLGVHCTTLEQQIQVSSLTVHRHYGSTRSD